MGLELAIPAVLLSIVLVYFTLFKILQFLYREHFAWFVASVVFLSPFGFVLCQARNLLELMWILLLTPFYGVFVLLLTSAWVGRFFCLAFAALLFVWFMFQRGKAVNVLKSDPRFVACLVENMQGLVYFAERREKSDNRILKKVRVLAQGLGKCWSLGLSVFLLLILTATLVTGVSPGNPTYFEVQQFVASDKTCIHQYIDGSYLR